MRASYKTTEPSLSFYIQFPSTNVLIPGTHILILKEVFQKRAAAAAAAKLLQSCPTLCDPIDGRPLGSSVSGILQARILEWGAIAFSNA